MEMNRKYKQMNINEKINYRSSQSFLRRSANNFGLDFGMCLCYLELKKAGNAINFSDKKALVLARKIQKQFKINSLYQLIK